MYLNLNEYFFDLHIISNLAGWQSGYAATCKAVYAGSIPASASKLFKNQIEF